MTASVQGSYLNTTNFAGTFNISSGGYFQGMYIDDPTTRFLLAGGVLANSETIPMWGGVAICESILPNLGTNPPSNVLGGLITRATNVSTTGAASSATGISVINQNYAAVINTGSNVPLTPSYGLVNFFRFGSNARIPVQATSGLVGIEGNPITNQVSWDFVNQQLIPFIAAYSAVAAGGITGATYTSSTGIIALTFSSAPFGAGIGTGANGVYISIAGLTGTGVAPLNGDWPVTGTATAGTVVSVQGPIGLGTLTITASGGTLAAGGGAFPCKVIEYLPTNSPTVVYNSVTNTANWNFNGSIVVIQI